MKSIYKIFAAIVLITSVTLSSYYISESNSAPNKKQRWVFFDLGDTIINTSESGNYHYYPGSLKYLRELKKMGIHIAIISNIPESFGETYEQKVTSLKNYVKAHWNDENPFDWSLLEKIYIPMSNDELKPAPYIYEKALSETGRWPSLYISETKKEVDAAIELGFAGFHFVEPKNKSTQVDQIYIDLNKIVEYIDENSHF